MGGLLRRAWHRAVRAEDAAIAWKRAETHAAAGALMEEEAGVGRHFFPRPTPAERARENRVKLGRRLDRRWPHHQSVRTHAAEGNVPVIA